MKMAREVFLDYLRAKGLNMTPQRAAIVETFLKTEGHFSSEQFYARVRQVDGAIGQATVYRTLKLLVDSGLAEVFSAGEGALLYEHGYGHAHHDHLICLRCGAKVEIMDPEIERRQKQLARAQDFELTSHSMILYGRCPKCADKE